MNAVTQTAPASASSSEAARVPTVVSGQTSAATADPSSVQPFTDVLSEQTSKASQDALNKLDKLENLEKLDKRESTHGVTPKSAKQGSPAPGSKKTVSVQTSTESMPLVVPVVPMVTLDIAEVAPARAGVTGTVHPLMEMAQNPSTIQAGVAADGRKSDSKAPVPSLELDSSTHPALGEASLSVALSPEVKSPPVSSTPSAARADIGEHAGLPAALSAEVKSPPVSSTPSATVFEVAENAGHVGAGDRPAAFTLNTEPTHSTADQRKITVSPRALGSNKVAKALPETHSSQSIPAVPEVGAKSEHLREASVHLASRFAEPTNDLASSPLAHSQHSTAPVLSASPVSALVAGVNVFDTNATTRVAQSMPHSLDIGGLAHAISRPLNEGNGSYTVVIAMHPADLGRLQAVVTLHGNDLQVSITPQTHMGRDALANAVERLKDELSQGGVNVNVTLHDPGSQSRGQDRPATTAVRGESFSPDESAAISPPPSVLARSQIHLIL